MRTRQGGKQDNGATVPSHSASSVRAHLTPRALASQLPTSRPTFLTSQVIETFSCILPRMSSLEEPTSQLSRAKYCTVLYGVQ